MKIYPDQLARHVQNGLAKIYIVSGNESLLVSESCDILRAKAKEQGFTERTILHVETGFDWQSLAGATQTLSLFGDKQLIELRMPTGKPGTEGAKALTHFAESASDDVVLMIISNKLEAATQKAKWFTKLESNGIFIQAWPIEPEKMPQWISARMRNTGLSTSEEGIKILIDRVQGNLLAAAQEVEKLRLLHGEGEVTSEQINDAVVNSSRFNAFELVDNALLGNAKALPKIIMSLKQEGVEPILVLWAIAKEIRAIANISIGLSQRQNIESLFAKHRIWAKRKPIISTALKRHSLKNWQRLLSRANTIDRMVKGMEVGNVWDEILGICLLMSGKKLFSLTGSTK